MTETQFVIGNLSYERLVENTRHTKKNGAVSGVNKKNISHPTREQHTLSELSLILMYCSISLFMLTVEPRDQFPRWRHSWRRLSVCTVLRCPDP
jgi:hypothetical protein